MRANEDRTVEVVPQDYSYVFNPYREPYSQGEAGRTGDHTY